MVLELEKGKKTKKEDEADMGRRTSMIKEDEDEDSMKARTKKEDEDEDAYKEADEDEMDEEERKAYRTLTSKGKFRVVKAQLSPADPAAVGNDDKHSITPGKTVPTSTTTRNAESPVTGPAGYDVGSIQHQSVAPNLKGAEVDITKSPLYIALAKEMAELKKTFTDRQSFLKAQAESATPQDLIAKSAEPKETESFEKKLRFR